MEPVSPWAVILSWEQPAIVPAKYIISGSINTTVTSNEKYVFYFKDTEIFPGQKVNVTIEAQYSDGTQSPPVEANTVMPTPSKSILFTSLMMR